MRTNVHAGSYQELVETVATDGDTVSSRYGFTAEMRGVQVRLPPGYLVHRSRINYGIGWMEGLQLIAGMWDADRIRAVAPRADHSLFTDQMAYGPRVTIHDVEQPGASGDPLNPWNRQPDIDQLERCVFTLHDDPNSRQALVFIARPWELCSSDLPCTIALQFLLRYHVLDCLVTMRSWDLLKGLPYDIMMFSMVHQMMAHVSSATPGQLVITAGSAHVYLDERERLRPDHCCSFFYTPQFPALRDFRGWARNEMFGDWVGRKGGVPGSIKVVDPDRRVTRKD